MGWIMMSSQMTVEPAPIENKKDVSDSDIMRVLIWGASTYFPRGVLIPGDPQADPPVQDSYRQPTGPEVHKAITDAIYNEIKNQVEAFEKRQAALAAEAAVQPIVLIQAV